MTLIRQEFHQKHTTLEIVEVICDKCGEEVQRGTGIGIPVGYEFEGAYIKGLLFAESFAANDIERFELELCGACAMALQEWVGKKTSEQPIMDTVRATR